MISRDHFVCPVPSFFEMKENWMKKSARVSEKLVSPNLQVATRLIGFLLRLKFFEISLNLVQKLCLKLLKDSEFLLLEKIIFNCYI